MALSAGDKLGPYEIIAPIGAGGMGQVFRALDIRLNRAVAVKICSEQFSARFEREARALAQLNHPHICTVHDVGPTYLVMELVEGETLSACLKKGAIPMDRVLRYGSEIADALAAAHAKGITHRDLKPGNIMITKAGVKVLDFGLAKTSEDDQTLTAAEVVLGTPAYMAPEQREGKRADARSDIYALGLVLREMATGKRSQEIPGPPTPFTNIVAGCLAADPVDRWQSAADIKKQLEWSSGPAPQAVVTSPSRIPWIIAAAATLAFLAALVILLHREAPLDSGTSQFAISLGDITNLPVLSPDGRYFAFVSRDSSGASSLWIRTLSSVDAQVLAGTEGAAAPLWSPDSKWLAFFADGKLKKINAGGGPPQTIAAVAGFLDGTWGPGGEILFRTGHRQPLSLIRDPGGSVKPLTRLNAALAENSHRYPQFLPDGRHFLFVSRCADRANNALYVASLDAPDVKRIMPAQAQVKYVPSRDGQTGLLYYYRDGALVAQTFDPSSGNLAGDLKTVVDKIGYEPPSIAASFSVSLDGRVIMTGSANSNHRRLVWVQRDGTETGTVGPPALYYQPRLSPDQSRVAFSQPDPQTGNRDLFFTEIARGITSRLTTHVANDWHPIWSPDGRQILFGSDREDGRTLPPYIKTSMDPGSNESRVPNAEGPPYDWSPDGRWVVAGSQDLLIASPSGAVPPFRYLATEAMEGGGRFSPDGKWIAYTSNESGRFEVYARPFSGGPATPAGKVRISNNGGGFAVWGPGGQEIFYMTPDASIVAVETRNLGRSDTVSPPFLLFQACPGTKPFGVPNSGNPWEYAFDTRDGKRFLVTCAVEPAGKLTILMNWKFSRE